MYVIQKKILDIADTQIVRLPQYRSFLNLQLQDCMPSIWYLFDDSTPGYVDIKVRCLPTGHTNTGHPGVYWGTIQLHGFIWHYFAEREDVVSATMPPPAQIAEPIFNNMAVDMAYTATYANESPSANGWGASVSRVEVPPSSPCMCPACVSLNTNIVPVDPYSLTSAPVIIRERTVTGRRGNRRT